MFSLYPIFEMVDNQDSKSLIVKKENWLLYWIEAQRKASISPRFLYNHVKIAKAATRKN